MKCFGVGGRWSVFGLVTKQLSNVLQEASGGSETILGILGVKREFTPDHI